MIRYLCRTEPYSIPGLPDWKARFLHARGVHTAKEAEKYLHPDESQFYDPFLMRDMDKAVAILRRAAEEKKRVVIYGDYDVDGTCAAALLSETLKAMGIRCIVYIPDRHSEGYGLNLDAVSALASQADVLVSVDCGITSVNEVRLARDRGMEVIVTDHHTLPDILPEADAVLSPLRPGYPDPYLCGAGVAWKLSTALKGPKFAQKQLDLAGLATLADMVPLQNENRVIAALGLDVLSRTARPGLRALKVVAGIKEDAKITSEQAVFQLAPRLNASGRLKTAKDALALLTADRPDEAEKLAGELDALNTLRRDEEKKVLDAAREQVETSGVHNRRSIVAAGEGWNSGVVGLAAGRLAEKYGYPAVVLAVNEGVCTGSARSAGNINIYLALKQCEDLFIRFGGHPKAAGLSIEQKNVEAFRARFDLAVRGQAGENDLVPEAEYDAEIRLSDVTPEIVSEAAALAPYGVGNPAPVFLLKDIEAVESRAVGADKKHLKLTLGQAGERRGGIAFGMGEMDGALWPLMDVLFVPQLNEYMGRVSAECMVKQIKAGGAAFEMADAAEEAAFVKALAACAALPGDIDARAVNDMPSCGPRGTLVLCRTLETAESMRRRFPEWDAATGRTKDRRGFSTVLYMGDLDNPGAPFDTVYLADGLIAPGEAELAKRGCPGARVYFAPVSAALKRLAGKTAPDENELRQIYVCIRRGVPLARSGVAEAKIPAAVQILKELDLIAVRAGGEPLPVLPVRKCSPAESPTFRAIQLAKEGQNGTFPI